ncbi:MAG: hypothetical protein F4X83_05755 [Chloroflexi bacterium]|nr:hypothetical protein [Chloroflexota bacterium]
MRAIGNKSRIVGADDGCAVDEADVRVALGDALGHYFVLRFPERGHGDAPRVGRGIRELTVATEDADY